MTVNADVFLYPGAEARAIVGPYVAYIEIRPEAGEASRLALYLDSRADDAFATRALAQLDVLQVAIDDCRRQLTPAPARAPGPDDDDDDDDDATARAYLAPDRAPAGDEPSSFYLGVAAYGPAEAEARMAAGIAEVRYDVAHPMSEPEQRAAWGDR